jgi:hypothetical protein
MKYLTVNADFQGTGLKDDFEGPIKPESLNLPEALIQRISKWLSDYQPIIRGGAEGRQERQREIKELDERGLEIAREVRDCLGADAKVLYYSEGTFSRMLP